MANSQLKKHKKPDLKSEKILEQFYCEYQDSRVRLCFKKVHQKTAIIGKLRLYEYMLNRLSLMPYDGQFILAYWVRNDKI